MSLDGRSEGLAGVRSFVAIAARRNTLEPERVVLGTFASDSSNVATFTIGSLQNGNWTLRFIERHSWTSVFPAMQLSHDSTIVVKVRDGRSLVLPELVLRPVAPFLVVATEICPWTMSGPPTTEDWGNCDSGYWGGLDVEVLVRGVPGTSTEGISRAVLIKQNEHYTELRTLPVGEYDVTGTAKPRVGANFPCATGWRLVPWRAATQRMRLNGGLAYTEFEFWCQS